MYIYIYNWIYVWYLANIIAYHFKVHTLVVLGYNGDIILSSFYTGLFRKE